MDELPSPNVFPEESGSFPVPELSKESVDANDISNRLLLLSDGNALSDFRHYFRSQISSNFFFVYFFFL